MRKDKKQKHENSIAAKIQNSITRLLVLFVGIMALVAITLNLISALRLLKNDMLTTVQVTAHRVSQELMVTKAIASEIGTVPNLSSPSFKPQQKQAMVDQRVEKYGMNRGYILDANGACEFSGEVHGQQEYFTHSMQGELYVSEPFVPENGEQQVVVVSAPLYAAGKPTNPVTGVVCLEPQYGFLNDIMNNIEISENASSYMINAAGTVVAHCDSKYVEERWNTIELSQSNSKLKKLAKLEQKIINGGVGYSTYIQDGSIKLLAYAPVEGTNGWSIVISAPLMDFIGDTFLMSLIMAIAVAVISIWVGMKTAKKVGNTIGSPIRVCADRLALLAQGDLHSPMPEINSHDETKILANATVSLAKSFESVIGDADYLLGEMANRNFAVEPQNAEIYVGDFEGLFHSMKELNVKLNNTLKNIAEAVSQVAEGSQQMSDTAQALAASSEEQMDVVQVLQRDIGNVSKIVADNARMMEASYNIAQEYRRQAGVSSAEMKELANAMVRINNTSRQIKDIIDEIEDIASKTNLLSLNAAIEAARAGEAGRGFTVVAEQIRKLATDSTESAIHTRELIESSLNEIDMGNQKTDSTYQSMMKVVEGMEILANEMKQAMGNSIKQSEAIESMEKGVEKIVDVIESTSATAQETFASSEELAAQATNMNDMVEAFSLHK